MPIDKLSTERGPGGSLDLVSVDCPVCAARDRSHERATGLDFEYGVSGDSFRIMECQDCGVFYLDPRPAVSELGRVYPPGYVPYDFEKSLGFATRTARNYFLRRRVAAIRGWAGQDARILDVGCGDGGFLVSLKEHGPQTWRLAGTDFVEAAKPNLARRGIDFYPGRFETVDLEPECWDLIIMKDVIEHLASPDVAIARSFQLLRRAGRLLLETPNADGWDARLFRHRYWGGWHFPRHWTIYRRGSLSSHLMRHGFLIENYEPTLSPAFWVQSIHHWLSESTLAGPIARWFDVRYLPPVVIFSMLDAIQVMATGKTSNMQLVARKP